MLPRTLFSFLVSVAVILALFLSTSVPADATGAFSSLAASPQIQSQGDASDILGPDGVSRNLIQPSDTGSGMDPDGASRCLGLAC